MTQEAAVPPGLMEQVRQIAREEAAAVYRSAPNRNASIGEGGTFTIKGGRLIVNYPASEGSGVGVYFGDLYSGTTYLGTGLLTQGPDGFDIASFRSDVATGTTLAIIRDGQQNAVFYTNNATGEGLGRPWIPGGFYLSRNADWPTVTSGTFETVYRAKTSKQHTRLLVRTWGANDTGGATGQIRVMVNGVQLGSTASTASSAVSEALMYGDVAGAFGVELIVEIQARLASGAGGVQVCPSELTSRN